MRQACTFLSRSTSSWLTGDYVDELVQGALPEVELFERRQLLQLFGHPDVAPLFLHGRAEVLRVVDDLVHAVPVLLLSENRDQLGEELRQRLELLVRYFVVRLSPLGQRLEENARRLASLGVGQLFFEHLLRLVPLGQAFVFEDGFAVDRDEREVQFLGHRAVPVRCLQRLRLRC